MYHMLAYSSNTFGVTNFDMIPAQDPVFTIQNGHYLPNIPYNLYLAWLSGTLMSAIQLVTPTSRQVVPPRLYPINATTLPADRPHYYDRRMQPWILNAIEEISMQVNLGGAANAIATALLAVGTSLDPIPPGNIWSYHGTATTAAVAQAWTQVAITWDQTIPAGTYVVIGSQHQSTNAIGHRIIFKDQVMRPGFTSLTSLTNVSFPDYYYGGMGALGKFTTTTLPFVEVYCNAADAAHDIVLNMVKVA
jgi:hypothetical protein